MQRRTALLLIAAAAGAAAAHPGTSNGLGDFLTIATGRVYNSLGAGVWGCVDAHLPPGSPLRLDAAGRGAGEPPPTWVARAMREDPAVVELTECLLDARLLDGAMLTSFAGHLAAAAVAGAGVSEDEPLGLLRKLLSASGGRGLDYTRDRSLLAPLPPPPQSPQPPRAASLAGGSAPVFCTLPHASAHPGGEDPLMDWQRSMTESADSFTLLHAALSHDKDVLRHRSVQDLLFEDPARAASVQRVYRRLGKSLALAVAPTDAPLALRLLAATRRLVDAPPVDYPLLAALNNSVPGRTIRLADKSVLDDALGALAADAVLAHARALHAQLTRATLATVGPTLAQVPHIANLLSAQDRFGRTPFHVAAATDNALGVGVLARHVAASLASSNVSDVNWRNVTAAAVLLRDANGWTARELAERAGNAAAAAALAALERAVDALHPVAGTGNAPAPRRRAEAPPPRVAPSVPLPAYAPLPGECAANGGWAEPAFVGAKARAAIESWRVHAPSECDVDVVDYSNCSLLDERTGACGLSPQQFVEHYFLPARPVVLRGYARRYELFTRWTPSYFLRTHGDIDVRVSEIPYAQQWGVQGATLPLKEHLQAMLACTPEAAATGLSAGGGGAHERDGDGSDDACAMPRPLVDIPPALCAAFTQDDSSFVRGVHGHKPLPSSRLYVFHSITRESAAADPRVAALLNEIGAARLPALLNVTVPLWSTRGGSGAEAAVPPTARVAAASLAGRASASASGGGGGGARTPPSPLLLRHVRADELLAAAAESAAAAARAASAGAEAGGGSGSGAPPVSGGACETPLVHHGDEVVQLFVGGPGTGAPTHYHQDAFNTLLHGEKHWYLEPPSARGGSPGALSSAASSTFSIVAVADYVARVLPALPPEQRPLQCTQRAGDVMYVPYSWGHGCLNTITSVGWASEIDTDYGGRYSRL